MKYGFDRSAFILTIITFCIIGFFMFSFIMWPLLAAKLLIVVCMLALFATTYVLWIGFLDIGRK